jgi:hypothetical protein
MGLPQPRRDDQAAFGLGRHPDVEDRDVDRVGGQQFGELIAIGDAVDDLVAGRAQQHDDAFPEQGAVLGESHPHQVITVRLGSIAISWTLAGIPQHSARTRRRVGMSPALQWDAGSTRRDRACPLTTT